MRSARNIPTILRELETLAPKLLFGSVSSTYRTCGKASCACRTDASKRHGPYVHVSYRADGQTRSYNVPAELKAQVAEGIAAWERFQQLARELAEHRRLELGLGPSKRGAR
jgi:Family of unknown function (DUF6788)